jgi:GNAT superfamily N-acetyltransferase
MTTSPIIIRSYTESDIPQLIEIQRECFPPPYPAEQLWSREQLLSHIAIFPAGALCAVDADGRLVGSCTNLIIQFDPAHPQHTWAEISDDGFIRTHNPNGNALYGIDVAVRPAYRGRGIARLMYQARFDLVKRLGLERYLTAGRLAGYHKHASQLSLEEYAAKVVAGELTDPVITPQLRAGLQPVTVIRDYIPDEESANAALMLQWLNPNL